MNIHLDETDAPNAVDREAARRIIEDIITHDILTNGTFCLEGYSAARRIAQALTEARRDERRCGFSTPFRMRRIKPTEGAPAVMAKHPNYRPLHHWIEVDGMRMQSYRADVHEVPLISDDGRIAVKERDTFWTVEFNGIEVVECGLIRRFDSPEAAARAAVKKIEEL
jgi:hypothetical protein